MLAFAVRRLAAALITLLAASFVVFAVLEILPGDPALLILGEGAREDTLAALRAEMGLDRPAAERYAEWLGGLLTGRLGNSLTYDTAIADLIGDRLLVSLPLAAMALAAAVVLALPLGLLAASRHGRVADHALMGVSHAGLALPSFWIGILLILVFAIHLGWTPAGGFPGWAAGWGAVGALLLPAAALAIPETAILARITRSAVLEAMRGDYVRTARAKGLGHGAVLWHHVLRNAMVPIATIAGLQFGFLMAGTVLVERVFAVPGLGDLLFQAVGQRDLPVVRTVVILLCGAVILVNLVVDLLYGAIDPRPRRDA